MRNKIFFIISVSTLLSCIAAYFFAVDRIAIANRTVESTYRQFLLKASTPIKGRIIISSGSNSIHGIDAGMMERHFGRLAINLGDNGNYPLEHKIYNLANYVTADDLIIFPLELRYYTNEDRLSQHYVSSALDETGSAAFYYRELPFHAKALFVFKHIPFSLSLKRILSLNSLTRHNDDLRKSELDSLRGIFVYLPRNLRGSALDDRHKSIADNDPGGLSCDEYILKGKFTISERFRKELRLLQSMVGKTGVKVVFTWPSVAGKTGNECYTSEEAEKNLDAFISDITREVNGHGFKFIGNLYESRFDSSCFKDTHYHIQHHCAVDRTTLLIEQIESEGLLTERAGYSIESTFDTLLNYAFDMEISYVKSLGATRVNVPIESADMSKHLYLRKGWNNPNEDGIWSNGRTSTIIIPGPAGRIKSIRFKGQYFNGLEKTWVFINGDFAGNFILTDKTIAVSEEISSKDYIEITLEHTNPVQVGKPGKTGAVRKIKYALQSIELKTAGR